MLTQHNDNKTTINLYVATNGNDAWSGTLSEPNEVGGDGPFATLRRAKEAVRSFHDAEGKLPGPVNVLVHGGKYFLNETLELSSEDSGTQECPITWQAYPGEEPIISGGREVTGWTHYRDGLMQCTIPETRSGLWTFRELYCNGKRLTRARYPKADPMNPLHSGWIFVKDAAEKGSYVSFRVAEGELRHWNDVCNGEVFIISSWGRTERQRIRSLNADTGIVTLAEPKWDFNFMPWYMPCPFSGGYRFYVENLLEELSQVGEWCLDKESGTLYFWPPESEINNCEVVAPILENLVCMRGVSWVNFSGFTFTETSHGGDNGHRIGNDGTGAQMPLQNMRYCGETIYMRDVENCQFAHNKFMEVGGNAIYLEDYNYRNEIHHNEFAYIGASAVVLIGSNYFLKKPRHPLFNLVEDNHIHHCGVYNKSMAGIFLGCSDGNAIRHNLIEHSPHHAINLGNSGSGRNIIEYNRIRHSAQEAFDTGAINCWMEDPAGHVNWDASRCGHIIRYNFITDTHGCHVNEQGKFESGGYVNGIYLDNFASNCFVYGNIIVRSGALGGVYTNDGRNNVIENNIIVDNAGYGFGKGNASYFFAPHMAFFGTGNRLCRNIFYNTSAGHPWFLLGTLWDERTIAESDYNLFASPQGDDDAMVNLQVHYKEKYELKPFTWWKSLGYERHSRFSDPHFVDAANDDYRLCPDSPAYELGFQNIPVEKIGIRKADIRFIAS